MIEQTEDTVLWENLKENSLSSDRLLFILVSTKVMLCVSPLLWGNNDAVLGIPSDKYGWLSADDDLSMAVDPNDLETNAHLKKYDIDIDEYNNVLESLETQWYVDSPDTGKLFEQETNNPDTRFETGEPETHSPGGDPVRIIRSKQLYERLLTYFSSLSTSHGKSVFESAIELWLQEMPIATMDMPGFRGSQSWCLRGVMYISLNLYLLKMKNLKIKNLGSEL